MTARGVDFLEKWVQKNVVEDARPRDLARAAALADRCVAEAAAAGISIHEMEQEGSSVETIILDSMVHLAEPRTSGD